MNLLHMKYAVEVADTHSLNKAAKRLYVGQPNLSRAIKELESSLGITIFERSSEGVLLTPDGEIFIRHAKSILKQIESVQFLTSFRRITGSASFVTQKTTINFTGNRWKKRVSAMTSLRNSTMF